MLCAVNTRLRRGAPFGGDALERGADAIGQRFDEVRMVVKYPQFVDFGRVRASLGAGALDIFAILAAAGVGAESGGHEGQGAADAIGLHLAQRVG